MNILVDGRAFVKTAAGISTFLRCSVLEWAMLQPNSMIYIFLPKKLDQSLELGALPSNIQLLDYSRKLTKKIPNLLLLLLYVPFLIRKYKINLFYTPVPCIPFFVPKKVKTLIVVHDVVNLEQSLTMEWQNRVANKLFFLRSIRIADFVWTNSFYTKERVEHYVPHRKCRDIFTGCSVDRNVYKRLNLNESDIKTLKAKYGIKDKFILFVGSLEPRKNLSFLLSVIPNLYREHGVQLVVVGGRGWKNSALKEVVSDSSFPQESTVFCGYITNQELAQLYNAANCFVSASIGEGFGMPQLEALLCGCPVVTAHNTAMIEVAQGKTAAYTVDGYEPQTWIDKIVDVVAKTERTDESEYGAFDWNCIVKQLHSYIGI